MMRFFLSTGAAASLFCGTASAFFCGAIALEAAQNGAPAVAVVGWLAFGCFIFTGFAALSVAMIARAMDAPRSARRVTRDRAAIMSARRASYGSPE